jgi:hypothetical protein
MMCGIVLGWGIGGHRCYLPRGHKGPHRCDCVANYLKGIARISNIAPRSSPTTEPRFFPNPNGPDIPYLCPLTLRS